jgi:uncharacterized protein
MHGTGIAFPPRLDQSGRLAWSSGPDNVRDAIRVILSTEPGERVMLPTFGAGLGKLLFEPNIPATHRLVEDRVTKALTRWEPRIRLARVHVAADGADPQQANVTIVYTLVATGDRRQLGVTTRLEG